MATQTIPRDLGLDLRKLPDLTDSATRKRLSPAAIEAVLKISEKWGLKSDDAMLLLGGISNGRYYGLKKSRKGPLTQDELTRVSLLIGIFKASTSCSVRSLPTSGCRGQTATQCSRTNLLWCS